MSGKEEPSWKYFIDNPNEAKKYWKSMRDGTYENALAIAFLIRAHQVMGFDKWNEKAVERLSEFIDKNKSALTMNMVLLQRLGDGVEKLKRP